MKVIFKLALAFASTCTLSACGTFPLAGAIHPPAGKNAEQQQTDVLVCKDQANLAVNSASNQAGDFLLGATIIGAPFAYQMDKSKERAVFAQCMTARGYIVDDVNGSYTQPSTTQQSAVPATSQQSAVPINTAASKYSMTLDAGWEQQPVPTYLAQRGVFFFAVNQNRGITALLSSTPRTGTTDFRELTETNRGKQASAVNNPQESDISEIEVHGDKALRFTVTGTSPTGTKGVYLHTFIESKTDIIDFNVVVDAANFQKQRAEMEHLVTNITGL